MGNKKSRESEVRTNSDWKDRKKMLEQFDRWRVYTEGKKCIAAAGKVQIGSRLWMNHKAKAIAGGFEILYKTWRHDKKSQRQGERQEK